jgi:hypothetical protein
MTPGEEEILRSVNAGFGYSFLSNTTMTGTYAQALGAAVVVAERAYSSFSSLVLPLNTIGRSLFWRIIAI